MHQLWGATILSSAIHVRNTRQIFNMAVKNSRGWDPAGSFLCGENEGSYATIGSTTHTRSVVGRTDCSCHSEYPTPNATRSSLTITERGMAYCSTAEPSLRKTGGSRSWPKTQNESNGVKRKRSSCPDAKQVARVTEVSKHPTGTELSVIPAEIANRSPPPPSANEPRPCLPLHLFVQRKLS